MRRIGFFLGLLLMASGVAGAAAKPSALFYLGSNPDSIRSFLAHYKQIDLLVPTWYDVDQDGLLTGEPEPTVLDVAHRDKLPVMPIVALFNKKGFHEFSGNPAAWQRMNDAMIREAKLHGYIGFQFDFEDISYLDRDALTALVKNSADALHKAGLQLSIATVPNAPGYPAGKGGFAKWIYTDWRGAFDIADLAKSVDLLCLMTYDQNTRWTMPGPVAGWQWTVDNLDYALKVVPKEKLSLGIPLYGYHWYAGAPRSSGTPSITQPSSGSTATRCASGSSTPTCTPSRTATSWFGIVGCKASARGFSAPKTPKSGSTCRKAANSLTCYRAAAR